MSGAHRGHDTPMRHSQETRPSTLSHRAVRRQEGKESGDANEAVDGCHGDLVIHGWGGGKPESGEETIGKFDETGDTLFCEDCLTAENQRKTSVFFLLS